MKSVDFQEIRRRVHTWTTQLATAAASQGWGFKIEGPSERVHGLPHGFNKPWTKYVCTVLLDESDELDLQIKIDAFDQSFLYISDLVRTSDFPKNMNAGESLDKKLFVVFLSEVYARNIHIGNHIEKILEECLAENQASASPTSKSKL